MDSMRSPSRNESWRLYNNIAGKTRRSPLDSQTLARRTMAHLAQTHGERHTFHRRSRNNCDRVIVQEEDERVRTRAFIDPGLIFQIRIENRRARLRDLHSHWTATIEHRGLRAGRFDFLNQCEHDAN